MFIQETQKNLQIQKEGNPEISNAFESILYILFDNEKFIEIILNERLSMANRPLLFLKNNRMSQVIQFLLLKLPSHFLHSSAFCSGKNYFLVLWNFPAERTTFLIQGKCQKYDEPEVPSFSLGLYKPLYNLQYNSHEFLS